MAVLLITGASGTLGATVADHAVAAGHEVRLLSRRSRSSNDPAREWAVGDLLSGAGIDAALDGADAVVHCAHDPGKPQATVIGTRNLVDAARSRGPAHLVYISIVGIDRVPNAYYRAKLDCERLIAESGVPFTILRATQFHEFVLELVRKLSRGPLAMVPAKTPFQPIDVAEVAGRLVDLAVAAPARRVPDIGGPQVRSAEELMRAYLTAAGKHRPVVPLPVPGKAAAAMRAGYLTVPERAVGGRTYDQFLAEQFMSAKALPRKGVRR
ncbi:uncharacterized protein YbjT (DUF2867 family) [Nocardia sp. GAS34]|uniref:SDR family oxidoreductase n=1 Tax=unclassified Nocardia TaxID=2637762 RepID=UPI003D229DC8